MTKKKSDKLDFFGIGDPTKVWSMINPGMGRTLKLFV